jgi:alpha-beta hydrolase superfamily lysophospholipase
MTLTACMPKIYPARIDTIDMALLKNYFVTADNVKLPLFSWHPDDHNPKVIILAVHGFNSHGYLFEKTATYFSEQGISTYSYDQRGFGQAENRGLWAGVDTYATDLLQLTALLRRKYPKLPLYWLGASMGGAISVIAATASPEEIADGLILTSPAIWARKNMPWYQQALLWTLAHTVPGMTFTGESRDITASDNHDMLIAMGLDPLVIKETRVETLYGLANLMDVALESASLIQLKTLLLYGEKDEIIPADSTFQFIRAFLNQRPENKRIGCYEKGYHMLLRDLNAKLVWQDIVTWVTATGPLPSFLAEKNMNCLDNLDK